MTRRITRRALAALAAPAALALGALAFAAAPASASTYGGPHFAAESFTLQITSHEAHGHGYAAGPVRGPFTDYSVTQTDDVFAFNHGAVDVRHTAVGYPQIDPATCSGFLFQQGRWQFRGLTGDDRNATGYGRFDVWESVQLGRDKWGHCDPQRADVDVYVLGWGQAANPRH